MATLATGCAENDQKKWDSFWGQNGSGEGASLFGRRAGDSEIWTIECNAYRGQSSREMADSMAAALKNVSELRGRPIWVEHSKDRSVVYCGEYNQKYVTPKPEGDGKVASEPAIQLSDAIKRDLDLVRGLAVGESYPFFSARMLPKPLPDAGPPEWDLRNAKGAYTLNVGVTQSTPTLHNYKEAAIEWVKDLRDRGYEAYYYHSPDRPLTSICVGSFGDDAVSTGPDRVRRYSDAVNQLRAREEFRYNLENGAITYRSATGPDGKRARVANESFLVKIPHAVESTESAPKARQ